MPVADKHTPKIADVTLEAKSSFVLRSRVAPSSSTTNLPTYLLAP